MNLIIGEEKKGNKLTVDSVIVKRRGDVKSIQTETLDVVFVKCVTSGCGMKHCVVGKKGEKNGNRVCTKFGVYAV